MVAAAVVAHAMMVAVAGAKGYKADNGEAYFDELVHICCFLLVNVSIKVIEQLKITRNKPKVKRKVIKI